MGLYFTNIQIKKNDTVNVDNIKEYLIDKMNKRGFDIITDASCADGTLNIYAPKECSWISVCSDLIDFENAEDSKNFIMPLSEKLSTDVMSVGCFDSDYLFVNLINKNEKTDGWINIGRHDNMPFPRHTSLSAWKNKIKEIDKLKEISHTEYVFAEDAMEDFGKLIDISFQQGCISEKDIHDLKASGDVVTLFLAMKANSFGRELPKLEIPLYSLTPCKEGMDNCVFVVNRGGKGKGIGITFSLNSKDDMDVFFKDVFFEYNHGKSTRIQLPIELKKCRDKDGKWIYRWENRNFLIPPKVNQELSIMNVSNLEDKKKFGVRFTPYGNTRKFLDIRVSFIPLENSTDGQCTWCVCDGTNESKREYIENYNRGFEEFIDFIPNCKDDLLNPDDYDL